MTRKNQIKIGFATLGLLVIILGVLLLYNHEETLPRQHFAIIPHFMLAYEKVDEFYAFLKDKRYVENDPETIIIISPNHFNQRSITPQTICESNEIYFQNKKYQITPFPNVDCDEDIFYLFGNVIVTNEHGIGEHLFRITKHFPEVKQIIPLVLPSHHKPMSTSLRAGGAKNTKAWQSRKRSLDSSLRSEGLFTIASVDFSHYLPEATARTNDQTSIATLESGTGTWSDFKTLDVDCPACLYFINQLATSKQQRASLYYRDSSSTILGRDMQDQNTSRVFMRYE